MTVQEQTELALSHHRAGRLAETEAICREILNREPNHAEAIYLSGILAARSGRLDLAEDFFRRIIRINPDFAEAYNNLGNALKGRGKLDEAIASYRQAIGLKPEYAGAHYNLGNALSESGQPDKAIEFYRQAIQFKPDFAEAHYNLANALQELGRLDDAVASYREAIQLKPDLAEAHANLGDTLQKMGQLDEAVVSYRRAIQLRAEFARTHRKLGDALQKMGRLNEAIDSYRNAIRLQPDLAEAHNNLGKALSEAGQLDAAIASYREAIRLMPDLAEAHFNLGNALRDAGRIDESIGCYHQAIQLRADYAEAHGNLGNVLAETGRFDEGIASIRQAIRLRPDSADAHYNLGTALIDAEQFDEAIASFRQAIRLKPDSAKALSNLGNVFKEIGQLDAAIAAFREITRVTPSYIQAHSNLVYIIQFHPGYDAEAIFEEHRRWNERHAEPLRKLIQPHTNNRDPGRRLRIGYVSPDFCFHVVGRNLMPLMRRHDHGEMEIFCYANVTHPDALTEEFQTHADVWRNIVGLTDAQAVDLIRRDQIDILVDLTLHMEKNRLLVFARKPAPVQATFAGYPSSTGLSAIDYRLTDPYLDPPGLNDDFYSEISIRLSNSFWCYDPLSTEPAVNALPAQTRGHVTFGCLNNFCKVNEQVLQLWARVLKTVDRSRMMILCPEGSHRQLLLDVMQREGIDPHRIELIGRQKRPQYLELYHRIDLGLDTFPYNGHSTSLDSFWMGVPVITLVGKTVVGRAGLSQLTNLGLPELIANTPEQYVQIAADLANDLPRLAELRQTLRPRMEASPLMNAPRFARNIEAAYRQMWRNWCAEGGNSRP